MNTNITCPSCHAEIEITEVMRSQLTAQIRSELEADTARSRAQLEALKKELDGERTDLDASRASLSEQVQAAVESQREELLSEARKKAEEALSVEIRDRDQRANELTAKLEILQSNELELRKRERDLKSQKEQLELDVARKLDLACEQVRTEAKHQVEEQHHLKDAEKEKQISDLRKQIDELKRKAEQGSQQLQGEVQEIALEDLLTSAFPADSIQPVAKGVRGADALQAVFDITGLACGRILWESKRTKKWNKAWLAKSRDDQRAARAGCVVIVTATLPDGVRNFALIEGVWVCNWACVPGLAAALRAGTIEVGRSKLAVQGQHEKMELVYSYLAGQEFQQRVAGVVEAFRAMQDDLNAEKRSMQTMWSKREKQLQRALDNTAGLCGDLQGIVGASMPTIEGLSLPRIESNEQVALASPADSGADDLGITAGIGSEI